MRKLEAAPTGGRETGTNTNLAGCDEGEEIGASPGLVSPV